jgi:Tfp pilus assembly protein PilO
MSSNDSTRTVIGILTLVVLAFLFWMLLIAPKRGQADELGEQVTTLEAKVAQAEATVVAGEQARRKFPVDYEQLVVLGKAVPAGDESASLLVQLNQIADDSKVKFESLKVGAAGEGESALPAEEAAPEEAAPEEGTEGAAPSEEAVSPEESSGSVAAAAIEPTEAAASLQPIGALVGPAGLSILPYEIAFKGRFFKVADFIHGIDSMIQTKNEDVAVDGRLVTLNGFALAADGRRGFPHLNANFSVTTYLVPPGQGLTAGASTAAPAEVTSTPTVSNLR